MREIALDTETTGLNANNGDRIVEIGCVEIIDKMLTGNTYHVYVNPERELDIAAQEITGLTYNKLKRYPVFQKVVMEFLDFIGNDRLIIHNAKFDTGFINAELSRCEIDYRVTDDRVIDTLELVNKKYPGAPASLDALCRRFNVNSSARVKHGALIDAELLAKVYAIMSVEVKQVNLFDVQQSTQQDSQYVKATRRQLIDREIYHLTDLDITLHQEFVSSKIKNAIWNR